jgi:small basic protein
MILLPAAALVFGFLIVFFFIPAIPSSLANYIALSILAGFDALIGGFRARMEGSFDEAVFVSGFFVNMILASTLAYLGDKLGVDFYLAVTVALGIRVFNNLGRIRGQLVSHRAAKRELPEAVPQDVVR